MTDKCYFIELFNKAYNELQEITNINEYISNNIEPFLYDKSSVGDLLKTNRYANHIYNNIKLESTVYWLDSYFAFWVYECAISINDKNQSYCGLHNKITKLQLKLNKTPCSQTIKHYNLDPLHNKLINIRYNRLKFQFQNDDVTIYTAIPEEFKAVFRRLSILIEVNDRFELEKILNPTNDETFIKNRDNIWCQGVVIIGSMWVKVRLILADKYGSISSTSYLRYLYNQEIIGYEVIIVGVSGHIDKTENVKIGDLVISDGLYDAYPQKAIETNKIDSPDINTILYTDTKLHEISGEYSVPEKNIIWESWKRKKGIILRPKVIDPTRESKKSKVYKGSFISGPAVIKQEFLKTVLQDTFLGALAVEMEASGCYEVIKKSEYQLKIIKAVCDWADPKKGKRWQPFCADIAAEFSLDYLIAKYGKPIPD